MAPVLPWKYLRMNIVNIAAILNEYCERYWILWEILNIVKIWFPPPCQINLSTVAKQSLHCLFAEEGKHYTAIIGFPQRFTRQINDNFTPHVFSFLEPISSCARNTHVCHSIFLQYSIWSKSANNCSVFRLLLHASMILTPDNKWFHWNLWFWVTPRQQHLVNHNLHTGPRQLNLVGISESHPFHPTVFSHSTSTQLFLPLALLFQIDPILT